MFVNLYAFMTRLAHDIPLQYQILIANAPSHPFRRLIETKDPYPSYSSRSSDEGELLHPLSPAQVELGIWGMRVGIPCVRNCNSH